MTPYDIDPYAFVQSANQLIVPQVQPSYPSTAMPTAPQYFGPAHQALSNELQSALMRQASVPGLLNAMRDNPAMSREVGGLLGGAFTPNMPPAQRIDWDTKSVSPSWSDIRSAFAAQSDPNSQLMANFFVPFWQSTSGVTHPFAGK